jgi:hypothetical protein
MSLSSGDNPQSGTVALTATPGALTSQVCSVALIQADPGNTVNIVIGSSTTQKFVLQPGQSVSVPCSNLNQIYAATVSSTGNLNWLTVS